MSKRRDKIVQELDPELVEGFTNAQKVYYTSLGFKPYLSESGRTKWLQPEQHSLRINASKRPSWLKRAFSGHHVPTLNHHKHRPTLVKIITHNWIFILTVLAIAAIIYYITMNPQLLI